jgi:hypothetical protein
VESPWKNSFTALLELNIQENSDHFYAAPVTIGTITMELLEKL